MGYPFSFDKFIPQEISATMEVIISEKIKPSLIAVSKFAPFDIDILIPINNPNVNASPMRFFRLIFFNPIELFYYII